jgi:hypothetical protein
MDAARRADHMAEHIAESERDYQYAWRLGSDYARHSEEMDSAKVRAKALREELKRARTLAAAAEVPFPALCKTLRDSLAALRDDIATAKESMGKIIRENVFRGAHREAFIDGAGLNAREAKRLGI